MNITQTDLDQIAIRMNLEMAKDELDKAMEKIMKQPELYNLEISKEDSLDILRACSKFNQRF